MPASAVQTKTWFRPKGWFTDREVSIVVNRVLRDDPSKGDMHNREAITPKRLWETLKDFDLWPIYILGVIVFIPPTPPATYITLTLRKIGFDPFTTNLLTIPYVSLTWRVTWSQPRPNALITKLTVCFLERLSHYQSHSNHSTIGMAQRACLGVYDTSSLDPSVCHCFALVAGCYG